jgi:hypothetical protein
MLKLTLIFIILFCLFSVILISGTIPVNTEQNSTNGKPDNKPDTDEVESSEGFFNKNSWYDFIKYIFGAIFGIIGSLIVAKVTHRHNTKVDSISNFRDETYSLFVKILTEIQGCDFRVGDIVEKYLPETNKSINATIPKLNSGKAKKLRSAYDKYSNPDNKKSNNSHIKTLQYSTINSMFKKSKHYKQGSINKGKDFAIHNIQKIIDLLK